MVSFQTYFSVFCPDLPWSMNEQSFEKLNTLQFSVFFGTDMYRNIPTNANPTTFLDFTKWVSSWNLSTRIICGAFEKLKHTGQANTNF